MSVNYTLYIPVNRNDGSEVEESEIESIILAVVKVCGGCTVSGEQLGYWEDAGILYRDRVKTISTVGKEGDYSELCAIARKVARDLGQEAVLLTTSDVAAAFIARDDEAHAAMVA